jgi:cation transport ATPase
VDSMWLSTSTALILGENLAAVGVELTYAGGPYLEDFAAHHARRNMTALLARTPRNAIRHGKRMDLKKSTSTRSHRVIGRWCGRATSHPSTESWLTD